MDDTKQRVVDTLLARDGMTYFFACTLETWTTIILETRFHTLITMRRKGAILHISYGNIG